MKNIFKISLLGILFTCTSLSSFGNEHIKSSNQTISPDSSENGPADEIVDLLMEYSFKISNASDAENYHQLVEELNSKLQSLDEQYPNFEPTEEEMAKISSAFKHYTEAEEGKYYDLEIYNEGEDDDESELYDQDLIECIFVEIKDIEDDTDRLCAMLSNGISSLRQAENITELKLLSYNYGQAISEFFERYPSSIVLFEDENSPKIKRISDKVEEFEQIMLQRLEELGENEEEEDEAAEAIESAFDEEYEEAESLKENTEEIIGANIPPNAAVPDKMPTFPGGIDALMKYLNDNMRYPKQSESAGIEGTVLVEFVVGTSGYIESVEILRSINDELDMEATRLMSGMPKWNPAIKDGKPVRCAYQLPVKFHLK